MTLLERLRRTGTLRRLLREERGQATTEYVAVTTLLLLAGVGATAAWPVTKTLFIGLQLYVDLVFFALNVAIG